MRAGNSGKIFVKKENYTAVWEYWAEYLWLCFFGEHVFIICFFTV